MKKSRLIKTAAISMFVMAGVPLAAWAASLELDGTVHWTAISGDTGAKSKIVGTGTDTEALRLISWAESFDNPCQFQIKRKSLNGSTTKLYERNLCPNNNYIGKTVERTGANEYITALQVCTTDKKDPTDDKVKGMRVWGEIVDTGKATLSKQYGPDEAKHTHCKKWRNKVTCPSGKIASKIKVYFNTKSNGRDYATGVALGCRDIELSTPVATK